MYIALLDTKSSEKNIFFRIFSSLISNLFRKQPQNLIFASSADFKMYCSPHAKDLFFLVQQNHNGQNIEK